MCMLYGEMSHNVVFLEDTSHAPLTHGPLKMRCTFIIISPKERCPLITGTSEDTVMGRKSA